MTPWWNPQAFSRNLMSNLVRMLHACVIVFSSDSKRVLIEICITFKFNYLSQGQLVSLNLDKIFLPLLKILPGYEAFFGNLIFAIIARMLCGNHLKLSESMLITTRYPNFLHSAILFVLTWWITSLRMILQYYTFSSSTISMICFLKYLTKISEETCAAFYGKKNKT